MYDRAGMTVLPTTGPFALRARLLSPLGDGGVLDEYDGLVEVDASGRIARVGPWSAEAAPAGVVDLRPMVVMPGLVDLHAHLPQLPNAGVGSRARPADLAGALHLPAGARASTSRPPSGMAPAAFRAFAAAGTTTVVAYGASGPSDWTLPSPPPRRTASGP